MFDDDNDIAMGSHRWTGNGICGPDRRSRLMIMKISARMTRRRRSRCVVDHEDWMRYEAHGQQEVVKVKSEA
ncbi:GD21708 [Drosophila simulans]|uniref:GD21708 n=1 Tax=Drosophila simulans TaxID=7240 RepID=B4QAI7_DROSI|nr:GD21708 [Drosophila simulans]